MVNGQFNTLSSCDWNKHGEGFSTQGFRPSETVKPENLWSTPVSPVVLSILHFSGSGSNKCEMYGKPFIASRHDAPGPYHRGA